MKLPQALSAFKLGEKIDYRYNISYGWRQDPFQQTARSESDGRLMVVIAEEALGEAADFRIRPAPETRIEVLAKSRGWLKDANGVSATFLAGACVLAAIRDVKEHLEQDPDGFVDTAFLDQILLDFCGPAR